MPVCAHVKQEAAQRFYELLNGMKQLRQASHRLLGELLWPAVPAVQLWQRASAAEARPQQQCQLSLR